MRLQQWAANGWLRPHQTNKQQIADLLAIVERDLNDSERNLSATQLMFVRPPARPSCRRRKSPAWRPCGSHRSPLSAIPRDFPENQNWKISSN